MWFFFPVARLCGFLPDKEKKRGKNVWDDCLINQITNGCRGMMMEVKRKLLWEDCVG